MAQANNAEGQQQVGFNWQRILMMVVVWWFLFGRGPTPTVTTQKSGEAAQAAQSLPHSNVLAFGTEMDLWVYISELNESFIPEESTLVWTEKGFVYGNWDDTRAKSITVIPSQNVQNNGSIFAHAFLTVPNDAPHQADFKEPLLNTTYQLNRYVKRNLAKEKKNLMSGELDEAYVKRKEWEEKNPTASPSTIQIESLWKGNLTLNIVTDVTEFPRGAVPTPIFTQLKFDSKGNYYPAFFGNEFWILSEDLPQINSSVTELTLNLQFEPISLLKWNFMAQMEESWRVQRDVLHSREGEADDFKRIILDNNPYVLVATAIITIVHMILDTLAFKNDIQFWKNQKSMAGLSIRSLYVAIINQTIILLYLLDNDTSWMILFSVVMGLLIDLWKVTKAVDIKRGSWNGIPIPIFVDKQSYASATRDIDLHAMKYLNYALYPLVLCYAAYSVMYNTHKSWYSFFVSTAAGCVYTFGFIAMTPQLFINYKLKSVAHLPTRVFVYKALSTFIDDIFVFLIRMPTLHRLRVFRDDIVFFVYLYQRWIYPVDSNRVEVGVEFEDVPLEELEKARALMEKQAQEAKEKKD